MSTSTSTKLETTKVVTGIEPHMESAFWIERVAAFKTVYPRLYPLAMAIQEFKGWGPKSRSFRNNNPGNLRYSRFCDQMDDGFVKFPCYFTGLFALLYDLWCKCSGKTTTKLDGGSDLVELFEVYAPLGDGNEPYVYVNHVAARLGLSTDTRLDYFLEDN